MGKIIVYQCPMKEEKNRCKNLLCASYLPLTSPMSLDLVDLTYLFMLFKSEKSQLILLLVIIAKYGFPLSE